MVRRLLIIILSYLKPFLSESQSVVMPGEHPVITADAGSTDITTPDTCSQN